MAATEIEERAEIKQSKSENYKPLHDDIKSIEI